MSWCVSVRRSTTNAARLYLVKYNCLCDPHKNKRLEIERECDKRRALYAQVCTGQWWECPCYLGLRPGCFYSIYRGCKRTYENRRKRKCAELPEVPAMWKVLWSWWNKVESGVQQYVSLLHMAMAPLVSCACFWCWVYFLFQQSCVASVSWINNICQLCNRTI